MLLLHGGGIDRARCAWAETWPALARRYRVIAPDLPGYGDSDGFGRPHGLPDLAAWLEDFMTFAGVPAAHLVGNSMGGGTALWLALERPERALSVTGVGAYGLAARFWAQPAVWVYARGPGGRLVSSLAAGHRWAARAALIAVFGDARRITQAQIDGLQEEAAQQARLRSFRDFLLGEAGPAGFRNCLLPRLAALKCPGLLIHGRQDRLVPISAARAARRAAPALRLHEMAAGHWPMRESPEEFQRVLLAFLDGVEQRRRGG